MIKVYNRKTKKVEEIKHFGGKELQKIYSNKLIVKFLTKRFISKIYGIYTNTFLSKIQIKKFIKDNSINMNLYENKKYKSFNDFFIRKLKSINIEKEGFISPCDAKLLVYKFSNDLKVNIKGIDYALEDLFEEKLEEFNNSYIFIYRLSVDNYHRFHYIDDGTTILKKRIKGKFHTVSSISSKYKIYKENEREYSLLKTKSFGNILYMEVGAMLIGKIVDYNLKRYKRGEEKGYFLPGASTVIVVAKNVKVDKDILKYSNMGIETFVSVGEKVGEQI